MSRCDSDFTDDECDLLRRARPHLIQAYLNALEHTSLLRRLGLSARTVQKHLERAYRKLGVRNRSEASRIAWRRGLPEEA